MPLSPPASPSPRTALHTPGGKENAAPLPPKTPGRKRGALLPLWEPGGPDRPVEALAAHLKPLSESYDPRSPRKQFRAGRVLSTVHAPAPLDRPFPRAVHDHIPSDLHIVPLVSPLPTRDALLPPPPPLEHPPPTTIALSSPAQPEPASVPHADSSPPPVAVLALPRPGNSNSPASPLDDLPIPRSTSPLSRPVTPVEGISPPPIVLSSLAQPDPASVPRADCPPPPVTVLALPRPTNFLVVPARTVREIVAEYEAALPRPLPEGGRMSLLTRKVWKPRQAYMKGLDGGCEGGQAGDSESEEGPSAPPQLPTSGSSPDTGADSIFTSSPPLPSVRPVPSTGDSIFSSSPIVAEDSIFSSEASVDGAGMCGSDEGGVPI